MLLAGDAVVTTITENTPEWLMTGLKTAGGVLPVVGVAILLRYLPTKHYIPYLLLGFFLAAYLQVPMLGVSIIGMIAAMLVFKRDSEKELLQQRLPEILKEDMMAMSDQKLTKKRVEHDQLALYFSQPIKLEL